VNKRQRKKTPYGRGKWHLGEVWDKKFLKTWLAMPEGIPKRLHLLYSYKKGPEAGGRLFFDTIWLPNTIPTGEKYV
jgi:hypothetical protein